jgi:5-methylcytosine-specific restriction enzyme subunit McrC
MHRAGADRLIVDDLSAGTRIRSREWVGFVRLPSIDLSVRPKLAGDNLGLVDMIAFASGLDALASTLSTRSINAAGANLLDLIGRLFVDSCEGLLRRGLRSDYVQHEDVLPFIRGRLLADRQVLRRFGRIDQLESRYDEHESDVPDNQLLAVALNHVARRATHEQVRRDAGIVRDRYLEYCDPSGLDLRSVRLDTVYDRLNSHYRPVHELAWLVLDGLGIEDVYASGKTESFGFLIDMNLLFERFVVRLLEAILDPDTCSIRYQMASRSIIREAGTGRGYASLRPDVIVTNRVDGRRLPIDAKYKTYDDRRVSVDDIAQTFLYAYAFGQRGSRDALLIHPASAAESGVVDLVVRPIEEPLEAATIGVLSVHIPSVIADARGQASQLLQHLVTALMGIGQVA